MYESNANDFVWTLDRIQRTVFRLRQIMAAGQIHPLNTIPADVVDDLISPLRQTEAMFDQMGATGSRDAVRRTLAMFTGKEAKMYDIDMALQNLQGVYYDEFKSWHSLLLNDQEARMFAASPEDIFGEAVCNAFPRIVDDLAEASKCYALGRGTACVFHLMRTGEAVAQAVAMSLGVIVPPNPKPNETGWGFFAKETGKRIAEWGANKNLAPPDWAAKKAFYEEAHADLLALNKAWRNSTMHMDSVYTLERAKQIMDATKAFISNIAGHIDEQGIYTH